MKVLVAFGSWQICERIIDILSDVPIVDVIWRDSHVDPWFAEVVEDRPDVVILDVESGSVNGMEVMKRIKRLDPRPVVIMTSDLPYRQYKRECLKEGADHFFYLPDEIEEMAGTIQTLEEVRRLDSARALRGANSLAPTP